MAPPFQPCKNRPRDVNYPCAKTGCGHKWTVMYREPGGRSGRQREKSFPTKKAAEAFAVKVEHDKRAGTYLDPDRGAITVRVWAETWLDQHHVSTRTGAGYRSFITTHVIPALGRKTLTSVTTGDIQGFINALSRKGLAASTVRARMTPLSGLFNAAVREKRIPENPCNGVKLPRGKSEALDLDSIPTFDQVYRIANAINARWRLAVLLMAVCGLRISEALAVSEDCVRGDVLRVYRQTLDTDPKPGQRTHLGPLKHRTEGDYREIPLPKFLADEIAGHIAAHGTATIHGVSGMLFSSSVPEFPTHPTFGWHWDQAMKTTGLDFTAHDLRHFFASDTLALGTPILEVSRWLGHRSITTTANRYGHLTEDAVSRMREAQQKRHRPPLKLVKAA